MSRRQCTYWSPRPAVPLPYTRGWPSIVELASAARFGQASLGQRLAPKVTAEATPSMQDQVHLSIARSVGVVRCQRVHYLDTRGLAGQRSSPASSAGAAQASQQKFRIGKAVA